ncbi:MAG TPA: PRC-barrel domain-containing protein [Desulfosporosinus sp.]|nr:PRC-barrel domain-containing protein [Desulfosporosinus sp.]
MKPTKEIIGLRIISISDGTQVGVVKDIVINPQIKSLDFLIIDQAADYFGAKVIAFADILGLGEFAVTIPHPGVIQDVAQNTEAQNWLKQDIRVLGTKVLTKKGQLIGEVKEILIDEETGHIVACLFESDAQMHEVAVEQVITLGKELLIVEGETTVPEQKIMEIRSENQIPIQDVTPNYIKEIDSTEKIDLVGTADSTEKMDLAGTADSTEKVDLVGTVDTTEEIDLTRTVNSTKELDVEKVNYVEELDAEEKETGFNLFEQRQLQYFIGKRVEKDIILDNTEILRAGERITPEIVTHITTRSTLMEVTFHLQKN